MSQPVEFLFNKIESWCKDKEKQLRELGLGLIILWTGIFLLVWFTYSLAFETRFEETTLKYLIFIGLAPVFAYMAFMLIAMLGATIWIIDLGITKAIQALREL